MKRKYRFPRMVWVVFAFCIISVTGCTKDDGIEVDENGEVIPPKDEDSIPPEDNGALVSGNPELNDFIITSSDETIYTVDAQTGEEEAIYTFEDLVDPEGEADYDNGRIFVTTDLNAANAIDRAGKSLVWDAPMLEYDFSSNGISSTICVDGTCYASGTSGVVVALDENTGEVKWFYSTDRAGELDDILNENTTPVIGNDKVYVISEEGFINGEPAYIHVLDKQTGERLERKELPFDVTATPLLLDNVLYVAAKNLYAYDANTLNVLWTFEANGLSTPFIKDNRLVISGVPVGTSIESKLYCLDVNTGNKIWEYDAGFDALWSPIIVQNVVFGLYERGGLFGNGRPFALSLENGEQLWYREDVSVDHSPVYANGRLFFQGHAINRTSDTDNNVGLLSMDANTGEVLWVNSAFRFGSPITPTIVAQNGVFGASFYRGN